MLAGQDGTTYRLEVVGDATDVEAELRRQPWVSTIDTSVGDGRTIWHVGVTDEHAADAQLLRTVLARPDITVASFGRQRYELEDVFIQLVEQEPNR